MNREQIVTYLVLRRHIWDDKFHKVQFKEWIPNIKLMSKQTFYRSLRELEAKKQIQIKVESIYWSVKLLGDIPNNNCSPQEQLTSDVNESDCSKEEQNCSPQEQPVPHRNTVYIKKKESKENLLPPVMKEVIPKSQTSAEPPQPQLLVSPSIEEIKVQQPNGFHYPNESDRSKIGFPEIGKEYNLQNTPTLKKRKGGLSGLANAFKATAEHGACGEVAIGGSSPPRLPTQASGESYKQLGRIAAPAHVASGTPGREGLSQINTPASEIFFVNPELLKGRLMETCGPRANAYRFRGRIEARIKTEIDLRQFEFVCKTMTDNKFSQEFCWTCFSKSTFSDLFRATCVMVSFQKYCENNKKPLNKPRAYFEKCLAEKDAEIGLDADILMKSFNKKHGEINMELATRYHKARELMARQLYDEALDILNTLDDDFNAHSDGSIASAQNKTVKELKMEANDLKNYNRIRIAADAFYVQMTGDEKNEYWEKKVKPSLPLISQKAAETNRKPYIIDFIIKEMREAK
jgi:hypothetical protein